MDSKRRKVIEGLAKDVNKKFGEGALVFGVDLAKVGLRVIPTGSVLFDKITGVGGLPRGRIIEISGPESSGKTSLCCAFVAKCQEEGLVCAYLDPEPLEDEYAERLGVNLDELIRSKSKERITAERWLQMARWLIKVADVDVIVVDSLPAMVPQIEFEDSKKERTLENKSVAALAALLSYALRIINTEMNQKQGDKPVIVVTNQVRTKIGIMYGNPEDTPGGRALKHYASLRFWVRKIENITETGRDFDFKKQEYKEMEIPVGFRMRIRNKKSKVSVEQPPQDISIYLDGGFNIMEELFVAHLIDEKVIKHRGRFYFADEVDENGKPTKTYYESQIKKELYKRVCDENFDTGEDDSESEMSEVSDETDEDNSSD